MKTLPYLTALFVLAFYVTMMALDDAHRRDEAISERDAARDSLQAATLALTLLSDHNAALRAYCLGPNPEP